MSKKMSREGIKGVWGVISSAAILGLCLLLLNAGVGAYDLGKVSPDLRESLENSLGSSGFKTEELDECAILLSDAPSRGKGALDHRRRVIIRYRKNELLDRAELGIEERGGRIHSRTNFLPFITATLSDRAILELLDDASVLRISPDRELKICSTPGTSYISATTGASQVWDEYKGSGVRIAVFDSGCPWFHPDLMDESGFRRVKLRRNFTHEGWYRNTRDKYGHGTHVAGIVSGNGYRSKQEGDDYSGIAPDSELVIFKVLDKKGQGLTSWVLDAVDYLLTYNHLINVRIANFSLSAPPYESYKTDPLSLAVKELVDAGITVVCAAGNRGLNQSGDKVYGGIGSPGISPFVITVGAVDGKGTVRRDDDEIALYSSRGPTRSYDAASGKYDDLVKPDVAAPGSNIVSVYAYNNKLARKYTEPEYDIKVKSGNYNYLKLSGTSMSAPMVSGAAALMLEANPALTPAVIKGILMMTAEPLPGISPYEQGAGELNIEGAVRLAEAIGQNFSSVEYGINLFPSGQLPEPQYTIIGGEQAYWGLGKVYLDDPDCNGDCDGDGLNDMAAKGGIFWQNGILWNASGAYYYDGIKFQEGVLWSDDCMGPECEAPGVLWSDDCMDCQVPGVLWSDTFLDWSGVAWESAALLGNGNISGDSICDDPAGCPGVLWSDDVIWAETVCNDPTLCPGVLWSDGFIPDADYNEDLFLLGENIMAEDDFFEYGEDQYDWDAPDDESYDSEEDSDQYP